MNWLRRSAAATVLASAAVCLSGLEQTARAAPPRPAASRAKTKPDSKPTTWAWLKAKAKQALPGRPSAGSPAAKPAAPTAAMVHFHWSFENIGAVELAERLRKYGFEFPLDVTGTLSLQLDVGVPWRSPLASEEYDLDGRLQSAKLFVAGIEVRNVSAHLTYDQGLLTLDHLKFELPGAKRNGAFQGGAEMQLSPPGELTARLSFEHVEVAEFLRLAPELVGTATGQASGSATGRVAVDRLRDLAAWRVQGNATLEQLTACGLPPAKLAADLRLAQGVVYASNLKGAAEHTDINGSGQLELLAPFRYSATLRMTAGKLSHLNRLKPELKLPIEVGGRIGALARLKGSLKPRQFSLTGGVNARDLRFEGVKLDDLKFSFDCNQERLHIHPLSTSLYGGRADLSAVVALDPDGEIKAELSTTLPGAKGQKPATLRASGQIKLAAPYDFKAAVSLADFDLARVNALPVEIRPAAKLAGAAGAVYEAQGTLAPLDFSAQGAARGEHLQFNAARIDRLGCDFEIDERRISLSSIEAALDDGLAAGAATLPLSADAEGEIQLSLKQIDLAKLLAGWMRLPLRVEGRADGRLDARIPAGRLAQPGEWIVEASLDAERILADAAPVGHLHAKLSSRREALHYEATGQALDGTLEVAGDWRPAEPKQAGPGGAGALNRGRLKLHQLQIGRLGQWLHRPGALESLAGTVSAEFDYRHDEATGRPVGEGRVELDDLRFNDERIADQLRGAVRLAPDRVELKELGGELAQGELFAAGVLYLSQSQRGTLDIELIGGDLRQLLFAWPALAGHSGGMVDFDLRMFHGAGEAWQIYGDASLHHGEIGEVQFRNLRLPLEASFDPRSGRQELRVHGGVAEMAPGRVAGDLYLQSDGRLQIDAKAQLTDVEMQNVLRHSPSNPTGRGKISGSFSISGRNVRSARDLSGRIRAKLRDVQGLPGSHAAHARTSGALGGATKFSRGELRAALSRGVLRIERLSLQGQKTQVYATGTATTGGRLDLQVTVDTGLLDSNSQSVVSLATQLALVAVPPLGLVLEANKFLSDQVVHLHIAGNARSPAVRVLPLPLLGEEALRFFMLQAPPER
ncbi:MAG TPA: AsmA-like C-terminal region-containing protein [Pirellulales bacterium]|jgi:hypothetical protein|nr:AsmA-like C-terminal region-containing protein [Pirellulales bacterium]